MLTDTLAHKQDQIQDSLFPLLSEEIDRAIVKSGV